MSNHTKQTAQLLYKILTALGLALMAAGLFIIYTKPDFATAFIGTEDGSSLLGGLLIFVGLSDFMIALIFRRKSES